MLAGEEAEAAARTQFHLPWQPTSATALEEQVRQVATRALFDSLKEQVAAGEYSGLFGLLGELQGAMSALLASSKAAQEELADRFDAKWIEQRANAGCLETADVHQLMRYLVERISSMQAAADDAETATWSTVVLQTLERTRAMALGDFIAAELPGFLCARAPFQLRTCPPT